LTIFQRRKIGSDGIAIVVVIIVVVVVIVVMLRKLRLQNLVKDKLLIASKISTYFKQNI